MTGNLSHQIEHHLFPDLPSNRYAEIAPQVRALFDKYELNYRSAAAAPAGLLRLAPGRSALDSRTAGSRPPTPANLPQQLGAALTKMVKGGPRVRRAAQARMVQQARRQQTAARTPAAVAA